MSQPDHQYDAIAEAYRDSKQLSFRKYVEEYTLFEMLGDVRGAEVLDLACGEGFYTRKIKQAGARDVTGVDISAAMVELARQEESARPLGCKYLQMDAARVELSEEVDLVVAMYLLNYARTGDELLGFVRAAFRSLRPGGRFLGFNDNVRNVPRGVQDFSRYGFHKECSEVPEEGDAIVYRIVNNDGTRFEFENYFLRPETYGWAFREAGFSGFRWVGPHLDPSMRDEPFWDDFMSRPPVIGFMASKP